MASFKLATDMAPREPSYNKNASSQSIPPLPSIPTPNVDPQDDIEAISMVESTNSLHTINSGGTPGAPGGPVSPNPPEDTPVTASEYLRDTCTAVGGFLIVTATFGLLAAAGLLQAYLHHNQLATLSSDEVGWIFGVQAVLSFCVPSIGGLMYDRYSHRLLLCLGFLTYTPGIFLASAFDKSDDPNLTFGMLFLSYSILCGIGIGLFVSAVTGILCTNFQRHCGIISGCVFTGASFGGIIWALLLRQTLEQLGWAKAVRMVGFVGTGMLVFGIVLVWGSRKRLRNTDRGSWVSNIKKFRRLCRYDYICMTVSLAIWEFVVMAVIGTLPLWLAGKLFASPTIFIAVAVMNGGCCFGRPIVGASSDIIGRFNTAMMAMLIAMINAFFYFPFIEDSTMNLLIAVFLWGFSAGAIMSMMTVLVKQISGEEDFGLFYGPNSGIIGLAAGVSIPVGDKMLDSVIYNTNLFFVYFGFFCFLAICIMGVGRYIQQGYKWKWINKI